MKFSQVALASAVAASTAFAAPAATTVTKHVHAQQTAVVSGSLYVENGSTLTSWTTILQDVPATSAAASATASATAAASSSPAASYYESVIVSTIVVSGSQSASPSSASVSEASASYTSEAASTTSAAPASTSSVAPASTSSVAPASTSSAAPASTSSAAPVSTSYYTPSQTSSSAVPASSSSAVVEKVVAQTIAAVSTTASESASSSSSSSSSTTTLVPATTSSSATTTLAPTSSSTSSSAPAATSSASSDFASSILSAHNTKRALHKDTSSLTWSDTLASYAQDYADNYDCSGSLTHSGGPYGENLACGYSATGSVEAWYDEIKSYDWSNPNYSSSTGHFTQVVWKGTSQVGCGIKQCSGGTGDYVICSYQTAGNFLGEFAQNVMSLN
ncbi:LANO_0F05820g1_1 [Lachancea nothofagi CBS 11611]|uniref:LANO_0F05820g1_1 n=1 Tax=Lachancea nothofagi CBS 11611 TaxID=1266666 RepID=A0A1G4K882_9SACH|nr:LANO_0F05820g1_1 [Lachancea nothofagi CBS 11611]